MRLASVIHGLATVFDTEAAVPNQNRARLIWIPANETGHDFAPDCV